MRLSTLDPHLYDTDLREDIKRLTFDCPCGQCGGRAGILIGPKIEDVNGRPVWSYTGEYPESISTQPSINISPSPGHCNGWHGYLTNGELRSV